jgi:uncharacterized membrane protein (DUF4010 family)
LFGGLVNSTAAVAELGSAMVGIDAGKQDAIITLTLITVLAMFVRNLAVVAVFSPSAGLIALAPILAMCLFTAIVALRRRTALSDGSGSRLSSPISVRKVVSFGLFFLAIQSVATLAQRLLGETGSVVVSFLGGFVSSASATAAAGSLASHHQISPRSAAICAVVASIASALVNLPIIYRMTHKSRVFRKLIILSAITTAIGLLVLVASLRLTK